MANIPGAVPNTSTLALAKGLNIVEGKVVFKAVADVFGLPYEPLC